MTEPSARLAHRHRNYSIVGAGALFAAALAYIGISDPHRIGSVYPFCPFKLLTGWNCPACGGLRMTHDLLHGDFAAAVVDNVFLLAGIPTLIAWILWRRHNDQPVLTRSVYVTVAVAAIAWTILRNLAGFPLVPTVYHA